MTSPIALTPSDLLITAALLGAAIALSAAQQLGLTRLWLWAALRSLLQLTALGYVLVTAMAGDQPGWIVALVGAIAAVSVAAAYGQMGQPSRRLLPWLAAGLVGGTAIAALVAVGGVIRPAPADLARYGIALVAVILGTAANSAAIAGERLLAGLGSDHTNIETRLCLGATLDQAIAPVRREAIRAGLMPVINGLMSAGVIAVPGFLAGQLLGGVPPLDAVSYQLLALMATALAAAIATTVVVAGAIRLQIDRPAQRLR
jgi:putative ABC transport system permease protein